jgi:ferredoxin
MEVCGNHAIAADKGRITVDYQICNSCGYCATACPTGFPDDLLPAPTDRETLLKDLHQRLAPLSFERQSFMVVFHEGALDLSSEIKHPDAPVIDMALPSLGRLGMETLLAALAFGAAAVRVVYPGQADTAARRLIEEQVSWAGMLACALAYPETAVAFSGNLSAAMESGYCRTGPCSRPAEIAHLSGRPKRVLLELTIRHLAAWNQDEHKDTVMPPGAPFGTLRIDPEKCTLCMACAGACAEGALIPDQTDSPGLRFFENRCVQCGLCAEICPENALSLVPRFTAEAFTDPAPVLLHGIEPERCAVCGKPFAAPAMIRQIKTRLSGHWMYQTPDQQSALHLCGACRVRHFYENSGKAAI